MFDTIIRGGTVVDGSGAAPRTADVGIRDGLITEIGQIKSTADRVVDADGALVTPGWVDGHTHYDGQVTWDSDLDGTAANGVTTIVMGNCGVGFAPVRPGDVGALIDLMEGVENIPGSALSEGMPWGEWETFPEYLDFLDTRRWAVDVGAQLPHGALRFYVMGERAISQDAPSADDLAHMAQLAEQAIKAGAVGFSTSRLEAHRSMSGDHVPGTFALEHELSAIARGVRAGGGATLQMAPFVDGKKPGDPEDPPLLSEIELFARISRENRLPVVFNIYQIDTAPGLWRDAFRTVAAENATGALLAPMVAPRAVTVLTGLGAYHRFILRPTYMKLAGLPHAQLVRELHRPEVKAAILSERDVSHADPGAMENVLPNIFEAGMPLTFRLADPIDYEPSLDQSLTAQAMRQGRDPIEFLYDFLLEDDGAAVGVLLGVNYMEGNLDVCREMILDPNAMTGLSDAGAHVNYICDMSMPTFNLTHWVRDRTRGERLPIELMVAKGAARPAQMFGLTDRGTLHVGKRADINVIDLQNLRIQAPRIHRDLPAGGSRFLQSSTGYLATLVNGVQTRDRDLDTGARPGRVARPPH